MKKATKRDHRKMLSEINKLVDNDFCEDICGRGVASSRGNIIDPKFTRYEILQMARIISRVYEISHTIYCDACLKPEHALQDSKLDKIPNSDIL